MFKVRNSSNAYINVNGDKIIRSKKMRDAFKRNIYLQTYLLKIKTMGNKK